MGGSSQPSSKTAIVPGTISWWKDGRTIAILVVLLVLTALAYGPVLGAGFVNWDDDSYVTSNPRLGDPSRLGELLTTSVGGNHHPLTMLTLALNHAISGTEPWSYHLLNLLLHLGGTLCVFRFVQVLMPGRAVVAAVATAVFALHPMHVESVAWVSERKDVLYALFYFLGLTTYLHHQEGHIRGGLWKTALFFLLSLLSKPAAVVFPLSLLAVDFLKGRPWSSRWVTEKAHFFVMALAYGVLTVIAQSTAGAMGDATLSPLDRRFLFASYGVVFYLLRFLVPVDLACFHPFPAVNVELPTSYSAAPVFVAAILGGTWWSMRTTRVVAFGLGFYLVNLGLVLQLFPVGSAVVADRYTYVPYIGPGIVLGWVLESVLARHRWWLPAMAGKMLAGAAVAAAALLTYSNARHWMSGETLWDQAIAVEPSSRALVNRALLHRRAGERDKALALYDRAVTLNRLETDAFTNRGNIRLERGEIDLALADYEVALKIKPNDVRALDNRGVAYAKQRRYEAALKSFKQATEADPEYEMPWLNAGMAYAELGRHAEAIASYLEYMKRKPGDADVMNSIGVSQQALGKHQEAVTTFSEALKGKRHGVFLLNRARSLYQLGRKADALNDAHAAAAAGTQVPKQFLDQLQAP